MSQFQMQAIVASPSMDWASGMEEQASFTSQNGHLVESPAGKTTEKQDPSPQPATPRRCLLDNFRSPGMDTSPTLRTKPGGSLFVEMNTDENSNGSTRLGHHQKEKVQNNLLNHFQVTKSSQILPRYPSKAGLSHWNHRKPKSDLNVNPSLPQNKENTIPSTKLPRAPCTTSLTSHAENTFTQLLHRIDSPSLGHSKHIMTEEDDAGEDTDTEEQSPFLKLRQANAHLASTLHMNIDSPASGVPSPSFRGRGLMEGAMDDSMLLMHSPSCRGGGSHSLLTRRPTSSNKSSSSSLRRTQSQCYSEEAFVNARSPSYNIAMMDSREKTILPTIAGGKDSLHRITPATLVELLEGKYNTHLDEYHIIDCRFPYEYDGGHIQGARNINCFTELEQWLLRQPMTDRRQVFVFHCEFSSHRAPRLASFLRKQDRQMNLMQYPKLFYPDVYILEGGYKRFFAQFKYKCHPQHYVEMNDQSYTLDLKREMSSFKKAWRRTKSYSDAATHAKASEHRALAVGLDDGSGTPVMGGRRLASVSMAGSFDVSPLSAGRTDENDIVHEASGAIDMLMDWE